MHTKTSALAAGLLALVGLTVAVSALPATEFVGTRADVRAFCSGADGTLLEGISHSLCVTKTSDVLCHDDGICASSDLELAVAAGFRTGPATTLVASNRP